MRGMVKMLHTYLHALRTQEDFLLAHLYRYAKDGAYTQYTSTREEDWRIALREPAKALAEYIETHNAPEEFHVEERYDESPAAAFGILEAKRHRARGVRFDMFMAMTKLIRQSFLDLIESLEMPEEECALARALTLRFWDKFELGFSKEWVSHQETDVVRDLQDTGRELTSQKNRYLGIFDSMSEGAFVVDRNMRLTAMNSALEQMLGIAFNEVEGKSCEEVLGCESCTSCPLRAAMRDGTNFAGIEIPFRVNGHRLFAQVSGGAINDISGQFAGGVGVLLDITARKRTESLLLLRMRLIDFAATHRLEELLQYTLDEVGTLTDSPIGFYHFVEPDGVTLSLQAWSTRTEREFCTASGKGMHYGLDHAGVWADAVREKRPVIHNDYARLSHRKGLPEGHAPVVRELVVPILRDGVVVAILGIGNKPTDYTADDVSLVAHMADIAWEITRRKRVEEELRASEEKFAAAFRLNAMPMAISTVADGCFIEVNAALTDLLGYSETELIGQTSSALGMFVDLEHRNEIRRTFARNGLVRNWEFTFRTKSGDIRHGLFSAAPLPLSGESRWLIAIADISDRRLAENALQKSEQRFRLLFESMSSAFALHEILLDADGQPYDYRFLQVNTAFEDLTGLRSSEIVGRTVLEVLPGTEAFWIERYGQVARTGIATRFEHYSGELKRFYDVTAYSPEPGQFAVIFTDITERKDAEAARIEMERQIQQMQRLESLGVLAGGIAHDFNNILMAVLGHASMALEELPPSSPARPSVREIENASRRAAELCRQMLAYSGKGKFVIETIYTHELIDEMLHLLKTTISKKALLNLRLDRSIPPIECDATQIRQVLLNLITNASEAIGERSGAITLATGAMECSEDYLSSTFLDENLEPGLYVYLEVSDTGCGMSKETVNRLFEPFFTTKFTGRGLGMAAVLGIVRGHRGAIKVYSEVGKGTSFKILLPAKVTALEGKRGAEKAPPTSWSGSGRVLLVDDEETVRALGKRMLEHIGFSVLTADDGRKALDIYREHAAEIDLVVLDYTMPHMDGEETFRELRRLNPEVRVMMSSGYNEHEISERLSGKGMTGFIQKPYDLHTLRECLRRFSGNGKNPNTPTTAS